MSRDQLAQAGGLSVGPIKRIETEGHVPKAQTLQQIADGLATYAHDRRDPELADGYYQRLMRAAGYLEERPAEPEPPSRVRPVEDLTDDEVRDALTRISRDPNMSAEFLDVAEDWSDLAPSAQRFILNSFQLARQMNDDIKARDQRGAAPSRRPRS